MRVEGYCYQVENLRKQILKECHLLRSCTQISCPVFFRTNFPSCFSLQTPLYLLLSVPPLLYPAHFSPPSLQAHPSPCSLILPCNPAPPQPLLYPTHLYPTHLNPTSILPISTPPQPHLYPTHLNPTSAMCVVPQ